ncbi:Rha family transcriptional regulator [uncultured Comamonas sp.]|uniref:Rha family transcriptional regulator n=1 Tax=uncultured Comamonas sp. TaxID=114710 RepID=UPI002595416C|nr:Rha family transcriptional regulator [uncultured Comamonas sp.]
MADTTIASSASVVSAQPELSIHNGIVTTTSVQVAQFFGKRHDNVLRAIRVLLREGASADYLLNFEEMVVTRENPSGGTPISAPAYRMNRDGFMLLAMGFTGKEALRWKLAYIAAFNRMEAELQKPAYDPARIELAHSLAAQAAAQVTQTVFEAIASGRNSDWRRVRYLLRFGYDSDGQPTIPQAQVVGDDQMVTSLNALAQHIAKHDVIPSDAQLAALVTACAHQLSERAQIRELRAANKAAAAATTSAAAAAPISPRIGRDRKPRLSDTSRSVLG